MVEKSPRGRSARRTFLASILWTGALASTLLVIPQGSRACRIVGPPCSDMYSDPWCAEDAPRTHRAAAPPAVERPRAPVIYLQPLGTQTTSGDLEAVASALRAFYEAEVRVLAGEPLPASAYYAPRNRYRAERVLEYLGGRRPEDGDRILGVTARDISTTVGSRSDWGMVGLSSYTEPVAVVSSFRCTSGSAGAAHRRERLAKIAVHEIGHSFGLRHCPQPGCLMQDARGSVSICERMDDFCPSCRAKLAAARVTVAPAPAASWRSQTAQRSRSAPPRA